MKPARPKVSLALPAAALLAAAVVLASCARRTAGAAAAAAPAAGETVFAVDTTTAAGGEILDYLRISGEVVTRTSVDVYPETAGKLSRLPVRLGEYVARDQVIAEVDPSRPGMTYVASPVKSPIAGTVIALPVQEGSTVSQAVPVARIGRLDELEVRTRVAERFVSKVRAGLEAVLRFDAYPAEAFRAVVSELSPVVDPQSRTLEVRLRLAPPDRRIKAGMFAQIKIITERRQGIVKVPADVIVQRFGVSYVFVVLDGSAQRRKVNPGLRIDNMVEITEGLAAGEEVVLRGQTLLEDKSRVNVVDRYPGLPGAHVVE
jgi:multidrug efflux pump subunit AcrA (membrane-fusion protein)